MIRLLRRRTGFTSTGLSTLPPRTAFLEVDRVVHWSHIQHRGRSRASSLPADMPKVQKARRKVSKEERRAMVASYVNQYRKSHEGKFPHISDIKKEVGGGYYVVRSIFQELQYKSRMLPPAVVKESHLQPNVKKESGSLTECESLPTEVVMLNSQTQILSGVDSCNNSEDCDFGDKLVGPPLKEIVDDQMMGDEPDLVANHINLEVDKEDASHAFTTESQKEGRKSRSDHSEFVVIESHVDTVTDCFSHASLEKLTNKKKENRELPYEVDDMQVDQSDLVSNSRESKEDSHPFPEKPKDAGKKVRIDDSHSVAIESHPQESGIDGISHAKDKQGHDDQQNEEDSHHLVEDEKSRLAGQGDDGVHENKSTLWGNLKSFAGGIINFWRKL